MLLLASRILIALLFIPAGFQTLSNIAGATSYFSSLGLPLPMLAAWGTGMFELAAGAAVLLGWQTRWVCLALAVFCIAAGTIGHYGQGTDSTLRFLHEQMFWKDVAIAGGLLALAIAGPGNYSADAFFRRRTAS